MLEFLVAAPSSGSGKTAVTCALLAALADRGLAPCAFKCGPDYIDPMFHRSVLGVESHNLDRFLCGDETIFRALYDRCRAGHQAAVTEGVMGYYDGLGGVTDRASAWDVARTLRLPVLLVLRPKGSSLTLAAQVRGLCAFREDSRVRALFLNDCSPMLFSTLAPMLERETGLPVVGFLPHREEAAFESRHLGLYTAGEISDLRGRIGTLAGLLDESGCIDRLIALFGSESDPGEAAAPRADECPPPTARIAVARDEAFCFVYEETLDALRQAGAEPVFFSPMRDATLPADVGGLYLPGGYPELHAAALAENEPMRRAVREAVLAGMPTVAECGGFLYLGQSLQDETGAPHPMAGALPGDGLRGTRLVRFGYTELTAKEPSLLFEPGDRVPAHEFHYWDCTENGASLTAQKPVTGRTWDCAFTGPSLYAGFPHLYFAGSPRLAERFAQAAARYAKSARGV